MEADKDLTTAEAVAILQRRLSPEQQESFKTEDSVAFRARILKRIVKQLVAKQTLSEQEQATAFVFALLVSLGEEAQQVSNAERAVRDMVIQQFPNVTYRCSCGGVFTIASTAVNPELCPSCHRFDTVELIFLRKGETVVLGLEPFVPVMKATL